MGGIISLIPASDHNLRFRIRLMTREPAPPWAWPAVVSGALVAAAIVQIEVMRRV